MTSDLIERIYEAAALPEFWPDVFHDLSTSNGFVGGGMITLNERFARGVVSKGIQAVFHDYVTQGWQDRNDRSPRAEALGYPGFLRDQDILSDDEIAASAMYVELLRPHGLGWGAGSIVTSPNGDKVVLTFERAYELGPTEPATLAKLDAVRPDIARAALFSGRLDLERARARVEALSSLGLPSAVLTSNGRTMAANREFEALTAQLDIGARDALLLRDGPANVLLREALERPSDGPPQGRSIPLRAAGDAPAAVLHLLPIRRAARDVFTRSAWLIAVAPLNKAKIPDPSILSGLYDLTPAEARVAAKIIEGQTVTDVAAGFGISEATVRTQLRGVFAKTGTERQSELVSACGGLATSMRA